MVYIPIVHVDERLVEVTYRAIDMDDIILDSKPPRLYKDEEEIPLRLIAHKWVGKVPKGTTPHDLILR